MKRRKIWSILALAALTGSLLAGCGEVKNRRTDKKKTKQEEKTGRITGGCCSESGIFL